MIVRTSTAGDSSFELRQDRMVERVTYSKYFLWRRDLKAALKHATDVWVPYGIARNAFGGVHFPDSGAQGLNGWVIQGKTQRGKKFISIGCCRFVGENRRKLIAWAKAAK